MKKEEQHKPENVRPAFLDVKTAGNVVELWPFLLQKAYAKYYSTYDSLANGNTLDFLEEITGTLAEKMALKAEQSFMNIFHNLDSMMQVSISY